MKVKRNGFTLIELTGGDVHHRATVFHPGIGRPSYYFSYLGGGRIYGWGDQ